MVKALDFFSDLLLVHIPVFHSTVTQEVTFHGASSTTYSITMCISIGRRYLGFREIDNNICI